jgi:hypothetical protein
MLQILFCQQVFLETVQYGSIPLIFFYHHVQANPDINVVGLSGTRTLMRTAEYYLQLKVGATNLKTVKACVVGASATWKETFYW